MQACLDQQSSSWKPQADPCNDLVEEDCVLHGREVWKSDDIRTDTECLDYLISFSETLGTEYFAYNRNSHMCILYDSQQRTCSSMTGIGKNKLVAECSSSRSTTTTEYPNNSGSVSSASYTIFVLQFIVFSGIF